MSNVRGKIFCQRCKSPNDLGDDLCGQCGTRLMLLVEPSAARFEGRGVAAGMEEHMLERVTAIENNISRVIDKLERMAELMLKQSRSAYFDHELLDTLITVLGEAGVISQQRLAALWRERRKKEPGEDEPRPSGVGALREAVLEHYTGDERELFGRLVGEGFRELEKGRVAASLRGLERAAALSPDNGPLNHFLGVQLYRKGRTAPARDYFARALDADPANARLRLLLGLACGDEGEPERARELLTEAARSLDPCFAAHCALGRLSAAESDWKGALAEFKLALAARPGPEAHYLLGLANFQLGRDRTALRHLTKAVRLDEKYGSAFYLLGLVHTRLEEAEEAGRAFDLARANDARELLDDPGGRRSRSPKSPPPDLFAPKGRGRRRLLTGGDARVAAALLADALEDAAAR
ncbi:MAG TPA: tetratricopeptide repeat protein [Pyrinomonadaceae bacterium]